MMAYAVKAPNLGPTIVERTLDAALAAARDVLEGGEIVIIEPSPMTDEEIDALPEFEGY
jgi:hypothetical protein